MNDSSKESEDLKDAFTQRRESVLVSLAENLYKYISELMKDEPRIDRITARAKGVDSFLKKAATKNDNGDPKYTEPLVQIQDQIGARIVVFYKSDVERIDARIKEFFRPIEFRTVVPDSDSEFGYFGKHMVLVMPADVIDDGMDKALIPDFFELQIKTLFQHAWSEANHDLGYKHSEKRLTPEQDRLIAFTSAQGWGADHIFDQLFNELDC